MNVGVSAAWAYKAAPPGAPHDSIRLVAARLKIAGQQLDATPPPTTGGTTGGGTTTGGTTGTATTGTTGGGPGTGSDALAPGTARDWLVRPRALSHAASPAQEGGGGGSGGGPNEGWSDGTIDIDLPGVRFASTHFTDGEAIPILLETDWQFLKNGQPVDAVKTIPVTLTVNAYNKLQTLGTNVNGGGTTNQEFQTTADRTTNAATVNLATHSANPGSVARSETRFSILAKLEPSTVMCALTHGGTEYFNDSSANAPPPSPTTITFSGDVAGYMAEKAFPRYNLVSFWACETLPTTTMSESYIAYDTTVADTAYIGFPFKTLIRLWPDDGGYSGTDIFTAPNKLGDHALAFWTKIGEGETVGNALDFANRAFPPRYANGTDYEIEYMQCAGDELTRLRFVYLTSGERATLNAQNKSLNVWWIKL